MKKTFAFNTFDSDEKKLGEFIAMVLLRKAPFEVDYEEAYPSGNIAVVTVHGLDDDDVEPFREFVDDADDDDSDYDDGYDYDDNDLELGFNPYMGCYDYDC